VFNIIWLTVAIYLFFMLMGWGATRLILPDSTRLYQFWLVPWLGLMVVDISVVWFSRLGLETNRSVYLVSSVGVGLLVLCKLRKVPLSVSFQRFDAIIGLGTFVAFFLAFCPLLAIDQTPTTISMGNGDPTTHALVADFLRSHTINQPPQVNPEYPWTDGVSAMLAPGVRPGYWLVLGLLASLFNLPTYKIFTLTVGVFFALTPPLITIFTWVVTKRCFPALIALTLSVLNVNLLYFNYHGFGTQVLAQGCMILAFFWFYLGERGDESYNHYLLVLGLSISSLFMLYPEISFFFLVPVAFYVALKLIHKDTHKLIYIKNLVLVSGVTVLIDPLGFWNGIKYALLASEQQVGWSMPRWAFPVDMVGLLSIHSGQTYPNFLLIILSLVVLTIMAFGFYRLDNKIFGLSLLSFGLAILVWLRLIRAFSYGYYKAIGFLTFAIILSFSIGLAWIVSQRSSWLNRNYLKFVTVCFVGLFSAMAVWPTFQTMMNSHLSVTSELANLSEVPKIAKERKVYVDTFSVWEQLWCINFLSESRISWLYIDPYNPSRFYKLPSALEKGSLWLTRNWDNNFINTDKFIWGNSVYSLIAIGEKKIKIGDSQVSVRLGENWWNLDKWWGEKSESKAFRWMNQDATVQIKNEGYQPVKLALRAKFLPLLPKTTVDVYLNNVLIKTFKVEGALKFYSISCPLKPGDNQLLFHVREGAINPGGDSRKIALGVNAIRFEPN
jgi:hypothetical protein